MKKGLERPFLLGCGGKTRTYDLWVMSPASYQLLHSAICLSLIGNAKIKHYFCTVKFIFKKMSTHKAGFVNIIGLPNAGKSTLINKIVGENLSIITYKAQTTRHRIYGIVNAEDYQIVYSDTPGILKPQYELQKNMMHYVNESLEDADILLYLTDALIDENPEDAVKLFARTEAICAIVVNKIDVSKPEEINKTLEKWQNQFPTLKIFAISALENFNIEALKGFVMDHLPESPAYFSKEDFTDRPERFFASEIIREKIFTNYEKEVPYSSEVEIEAFKLDGKMLRISAIINVERQTQKGIIIGSQGSKLKKVATESRIAMEAFFGKKVFLEVFVKVKKDWRKDPKQLNRFGYQ